LKFENAFYTKIASFFAKATKDKMKAAKQQNMRRGCIREMANCRFALNDKELSLKTGLAFFAILV
jgi:hypothetical protein